MENHDEQMNAQLNGIVSLKAIAVDASRFFKDQDMNNSFMQFGILTEKLDVFLKEIGKMVDAEVLKDISNKINQVLLKIVDGIQNEDYDYVAELFIYEFLEVIEYVESQFKLVEE